jgi:hypothetical protein
MSFNHNATWEDQAAAPSTPAADKWKLYFKSDGLYYVDDAGIEYGPLEAIAIPGSGGEGAAPNTVTLFYAGVDLKTVADYTIAVPAGKFFWPGEIGIIVDTLNTLTSQPEVQAGITGNTDKLLTPTATTELTAAQKRETFTALTPTDGETSVTVGVTTAAVATEMTATFYVRGILK